MPPTPQRAYHHGDLAEALIAEGLAVCAEAGPTALSLRDLATRVGVSPTAAYRHFPSLDHLRAQVAQRARERLAERLITACDTTPRARSRADRARRRLRALGEAYVQFARDEPHVFDTAFAPCPVAPPRPDEPSAWTVLNDALDDLVAAGVLPEQRRSDAVWIAWSAVHGLASVLVRSVQPEPVDDRRALDAVLDGVDRALRTP